MKKHRVVNDIITFLNDGSPSSDMPHREEDVLWEGAGYPDSILINGLVNNLHRSQLRNLLSGVVLWEGDGYPDLDEAAGVAALAPPTNEFMRIKYPMANVVDVVRQPIIKVQGQRLIKGLGWKTLDMLRIDFDFNE